MTVMVDAAAGCQAGIGWASKPDGGFRVEVCGVTAGTTTYTDAQGIARTHCAQTTHIKNVRRRFPHAHDWHSVDFGTVCSCGEER